jgi:FtsZ-interacting cell division protein ZipA
VLPLIIIAVVVIPLLVVAFRATRRSKIAGEHPIPEDDRTKQRIEQEFAEAEEYQEQWREEEKKHPRNTIV